MSDKAEEMLASIWDHFGKELKELREAKDSLTYEDTLAVGIFFLVSVVNYLKDNHGLKDVELIVIHNVLRFLDYAEKSDSYITANFHKDSPETVCLVGSSAFKKEHEEAMRKLTLEGKVVIPLGLYGHLEGLDMSGEVKKKLDLLHLHKIDKSDAIFVVNPKVVVCQNCLKRCQTYYSHSIGENHLILSSCCNEETAMVAYVGESTANEIRYAVMTGKKVYWLEAPNE